MHSGGGGEKCSSSNFVISNQNILHGGTRLLPSSLYLKHTTRNGILITRYVSNRVGENVPSCFAMIVGQLSQMNRE